MYTYCKQGATPHPKMLAIVDDDGNEEGKEAEKKLQVEIELYTYKHGWRPPSSRAHTRMGFNFN